MHGDAAEAAKHTGSVDSCPPALGMAGDQGVLAGAGAVHPVQPPSHPQPSLVESSDLRVGYAFTHDGKELVQPAGGPGGHRRDGAFAHRCAKQLGQRLRGAFLRQKLPHIEIEHDGGDPGPVLYWAAYRTRGRAAGRGTTNTAARDELVLGHSHPHRRQVEHLPPLHAHLRRLRQIRTTSAATAGLVPHRFIRVGHLRQRRTRMTLLPARFPSALAAQRFRRGLSERRIRRRRLRGVPTVLPQLAPQLSNLSLKLSDPLSLRRDESSKLLIGRRQTSRHHNMINELTPRSTSHAAQGLTSYRCSR